MGLRRAMSDEGIGKFWYYSRQFLTRTQGGLKQYLHKETPYSTEVGLRTGLRTDFKKAHGFLWQGLRKGFKEVRERDSNCQRSLGDRQQGQKNTIRKNQVVL